MQQTFSCPRCGSMVISGSVFCGNCGNSLSWQRQTIPPSIYQQTVNYQQQSPSFHQQQPDYSQQLQYRMNWFQRHLNWTWLIVVLPLELLRSAYLPFSHITFPLFFWILLFISYLIVEIIVTLWALRRKSRSAWWLSVPLAVLFLSNNRIE
jgi:hypothetical protein